MVKRHFGQKIRTRIFKAETKELRQECWFRLQKGRMKEKQENVVSGKHKDSVQKGDACSFRHDDNQLGKKTQSSSLAPRQQTDNVGRKPSEGKSPRGSSLCGRRNQISVQTLLYKGTVRIRPVIIGILPHVKITNLNRDANSANSADSDTLRLTARTTEKPNKSGGKVSVALLKNSKHLDCVFQGVGQKRSVHF